MFNTRGDNPHIAYLGQGQSKFNSHCTFAGFQFNSSVYLSASNSRGNDPYLG